jgi:hypothetical protein
VEVDGEVTESEHEEAWHSGSEVEEDMEETWAKREAERVRIHEQRWWASHAHERAHEGACGGDGGAREEEDYIEMDDEVGYGGYTTTEEEEGGGWAGT